MYIADNVLTHALKNVYWVLGGACGGKTTAARRLSEKYGMPHYNADERILAHKSIANPEQQPAMCRTFGDWEAYFARPVADYAQWLDDMNREAAEMCVVDLIRLAADGPVVFEGHVPVPSVIAVAPLERVAYLHADEAIMRRDYFARSDKDDMRVLIQSLSDPRAILEKVYATVALGNLAGLRHAEAAGIAIFRRKADGSPEEALARIERHFGLTEPK